LVDVRYAPKTTEIMRRGERSDVPLATLCAWHEMKETGN
jgi:hypothetical protein